MVYRAIEVTPEQTVLAFTLKHWGRVDAGNGIQHRWRGSFNLAIDAGLLVIDAKRNVPLSCECRAPLILDETLRESFDDYVEAAPGQLVPLRVRIDLIDESDAMHFDWTFHVYRPGLWLFSASRNTRQPQAPPVAKLENARIDGQPAEPVH